MHKNRPFGLVPKEFEGLAFLSRKEPKERAFTPLLAPTMEERPPAKQPRRFRVWRSWWECVMPGNGAAEAWGGKNHGVARVLFFFAIFYYWSGLGLVVWAVLYWVLRGLSNWIVFGPKLACNNASRK
ncbi:hypothetical protein ES332_A11G032800v1 [Gossypium tomentosum]|uniref:Uncharacterized protein n=1 Tax=Gossypium tomentosum TaxID=34277 RepID=A0A5D2N4W4_GOSTO|nr:hypothetical protein ES332_A11G032800v1 [Gossypium tomentosum]